MDSTIPNGSGIYSRDISGRVLGRGRTPSEKLDELPKLPWDWCVGRGYSHVPLSTMRGCPFDCTFCEVIAFMGRRVSTRSLNHVILELTHACQAIGTNRVSVLDDTFTLNRRRIFDFCSLVRAELPSLRFSIYSRIDTIDPEMMESLAGAGCERVFFGIDAGDNALLTRISKGFNIETAKEVLFRAAEYFNVTASLIWGYPFESWKSFELALDLAYRLAGHDASFRIQPQLHLLSPSAGTPLFVEYGGRLEFEESVEGLVCGTISAFESESGYHDVKAVIENEPILAAPFYRYVTPEFDRKLEAVERFNKVLDQKPPEKPWQIYCSMVRSVSEMNLSDDAKWLLGRLVADPGYRSLFRSDPTTALCKLGVNLSEVERAFLTSCLRELDAQQVCSDGELAFQLAKWERSLVPS